MMTTLHSTHNAFSREFHPVQEFRVGVASTGRHLAAAILVWSVVGAVAVPLLMSVFSVDSDNAIAAVIVFMGVMSVVCRLALAGMEAIGRRAAHIEKPLDIDEKEHRRLHALAVMTVMAIGLVLFGITSLVSSFAYSSLGMTWASEAARAIAFATGFSGLTCIFLVPATMVFWVISESLEVASLWNRTLRVSLVALVMFVTGVSSTTIPSLLRHHTCLTRSS